MYCSDSMEWQQNTQMETLNHQMHFSTISQSLSIINLFIYIYILLKTKWWNGALYSSLRKKTSTSPQAVTLLCPSLHFLFQSRQFAPHMMQHLGAIKTFTASRWVFHQLIWKMWLNQIGSFPPYRDEHLFIKKKSNHHSDSGGWNCDTTNAPRTSKIVFFPEGLQNCQRYDWDACYVCGAGSHDKFAGDWIPFKAKHSELS